MSKVLRDYRTKFKMEDGVFTRILELDWVVEGMLTHEHISNPSPDDYKIAFMLWERPK